MAIRFYEGASMKSTKILSQAGKSAAVQKNSMKGLPGFIQTKADASSGGLTKGKGIGPHREGTIGKRGSGSPAKFNAVKFRGSSDKSYRATSTATPGKIVSNTVSLAKEKGGEKEGAQRGKPTRGAKIAGVHSANRFSASGAGHPGRMESLRGKARMSGER